MGDFELNRRDVLASSGAAGVGAMAGCVYGFQGRRSDPPTGIDVDRVAADPADIPPPVDWDEPREHEISMATREVTAEISPGATFDFMTFDGQIPGPMVRVRRGDRIRFKLTNPQDSDLPHNIDFHAVYGPGGGAEDTTIAPGESAEIAFRAMYPGIFIYHCAVPNFDHHISAGMYGAILVEPEDGLPVVDRELYFGQNEIYTKSEPGAGGHLSIDFDGMSNESPTYVTFNGEPYAFTDNNYGAIDVETDEEIRLFFVNGGPNLSSSWHAIGNVWSLLYRDGDVLSEPARFIETTAVPPGTATIAHMDTPVPGPVKLVDHAVTRPLRRGALGVINVVGEEKPDIYTGAGDRGNERPGELADFDGWMEDVENYSGVIDETGRDTVRVVVGADGNGGGFAFEPAAIEVSPGTTVVWEWTGDGGYHNVVDEGGAFESETTQTEGFTFEYEFDEADTVYKYSCTPHVTLGMKGVVVVEAVD